MYPTPAQFVNSVRSKGNQVFLSVQRDGSVQCKQTGIS